MKLLGELINKYVSKNILQERQNGPSDLKSTLRRVYGQIRLTTSDWFSYANFFQAEPFHPVFEADL